MLLYFLNAVGNKALFLSSGNGMGEVCLFSCGNGDKRRVGAF